MANINGVDFDDLDGINGLIRGEVTTTPTITTSGGLFGQVTVRVTNYSSYTNPNFTVSSAVGATTTVSDTAVARVLATGSSRLSDTLSIADASTTTGTRTVTVKAQEFGEFAESAAATATYDVSYIQAPYIRIRGVTSTGADTNNRIAIIDVRFYTAAGQLASSSVPSGNLTSDTSDSSVRVSQGHVYSQTYAAWKAMDNSQTTLAWLLGTSAANNWWQIQFTGKPTPTIKSMSIKFHTQTDATHFKLSSSSTGAFTGEETDHGVFDIKEGTSQTFG